MADRDPGRLLTPEPPPPDPAFLAQEAELWAKVVADLGDEAPHRQYVGFVLKHNLIKNGTRRYGEVIDDKERFSVEQRRVARQYQQHLVRLLFFLAPAEKAPQRLRGLRAVGLFATTVAMLAGLGAIAFDQGESPSVALTLLKGCLPIGAVVIILVIWDMIRKSKGDSQRRAP
jgi:hypothetical protein